MHATAKLTVRSLVLGLFALQCVCGTRGPESGARIWNVVDSAPQNPGARHDDVFFLDERQGWIANTAGEVHRTMDGGETWTRIAANRHLLFRSIGFATPLIGWAGNLNRLYAPAPDSALWETRDGGATWTNVADRISGPDPAGICGIWVVDESNVFAVGRWPGSAIFLRSRDGGRSWVSRDLSPLATTLIDVYFHDENNGIVVGGTGWFMGTNDPYPVRSPYPEKSVILRTTDGGDTWEQVYVSSTQDAWAWKISFATPLVGYVSNEGFAAGSIVKTADGGRTWSEISTGYAVAFQGIGFATVDTGWVASQQAVYETTDGGATWVETSVGKEINRFRFLRSGGGFAVGRGLYRLDR